MVPSNFCHILFIPDFYSCHFIGLILCHFILLVYLIMLSLLFLSSKISFLFSFKYYSTFTNGRQKYWLKGCISEVNLGPKQGMLRDIFPSSGLYDVSSRSPELIPEFPPKINLLIVKSTWKESLTTILNPLCEVTQAAYNPKISCQHKDDTPLWTVHMKTKLQ